MEISMESSSLVMRLVVMFFRVLFFPNFLRRRIVVLERMFKVGMGGVVVVRL